MFMSFVPFGLRKGVELVEALASGHTQDPWKKGVLNWNRTLSIMFLIRDH